MTKQRLLIDAELVTIGFISILIGTLLILNSIVIQPIIVNTNEYTIINWTYAFNVVLGPAIVMSGIVCLLTGFSLEAKRK